MSVEKFQAHLRTLAPDVPCDDQILTVERSPLALPLQIGEFKVGNRWTIHPMEGWDGEPDGNPGELTRRRWRNFGDSGAKLIWGGEAVAVRFDGRANPNQVVMAEETIAGIAALRQELIDAHQRRFSNTDDLLVGLQLTHSGRFARPGKTAQGEARVAYRHPILDLRFGVASDAQVFTDAEVDDLIGDFVSAAVRAQRIGFQFVDIKHCHGYLLHEFLGAHTREGRFGGSFENRTRLLHEIVSGIRRDAPGLEIAVRVSIFDMIPFRADPDGGGDGELGPGIPAEFPAGEAYRYGFGVAPVDPTKPQLDEGHRLIELLRKLGVRLVNVSGGSPYYNPHIQRPALYPPSDGYQPPEDPLVGVVRQMRVVRELKERAPDIVMVGSALSYLQEFLPHIAQAIVRDGWMDSVGIGRMVLTYWDLPADSLEKGELTKRRICRTFSDCTTAPRNGLLSGCYPLDKYYSALPDGEKLRAIKRGQR